MINQSEILYYTISSNNYYHITRMMLESFIKNCTGEILVVSDQPLKDIFEHSRIHYMDASSMIEEYFINPEQQIQARKIYRFSLFAWLKDQPHRYLQHYNKKVVVCIDGDILFFSNITNFIIDKIQESPDAFFISSDTKIKYGVNHNLVNIGFWFCNKDLYPLELLMIELNKELCDTYANCKNPDNLLRKYTDQIILRKLLLLDRYKNYKVLCPKTITIKNKQQESILCHYFKRRLHRMFTDYDNYIKS